MGKIPSEITRSSIIEALTPFIKHQFFVFKSKNKGKSKFSYVKIDLINPTDFENLLTQRYLAIPSPKRSLEQGCYGNNEQKFFTRSVGKKGDFGEDEDNLCWFEMQRYKSIDERLDSVKEVLGKRLYIDGFEVGDLNDGLTERDLRLDIEELRFEIKSFFSFFGQVNDVFLKLKDVRILSFVTFEDPGGVENCLHYGKTVQLDSGENISILKFRNKIISVGKKEENFGRMKLALSQKHDRSQRKGHNSFHRRKNPRKVSSNQSKNSKFWNSQDQKMRVYRGGEDQEDSEREISMPLYTEWSIDPFRDIPNPQQVKDWMGYLIKTKFNFSDLSFLKESSFSQMSRSSKLNQKFSNQYPNQTENKNLLLQNLLVSDFPKNQFFQGKNKKKKNLEFSKRSKVQTKISLFQIHCHNFENLSLNWQIYD